jgi:hypothetical protein
MQGFYSVKEIERGEPSDSHRTGVSEGGGGQEEAPTLWGSLSSLDKPPEFILPEGTASLSPPCSVLGKQGNRFQACIRTFVNCTSCGRRSALHILMVAQRFQRDLFFFLLKEYFLFLIFLFIF